MSALTLIKRYTSKAVGIIVDRHAPAPTGKLIEDPQGEWIKWNDLAILHNRGVLIEKTEALDELVADGHAQRAFIRDVTALGYEDFDQIMSLLKECREHVLCPREFEIWSVGWRDNSHYEPPSLIGRETALSFREACEKLVVTIGPKKTDQLSFDPITGKYSNYCGELQPSEVAAKATLG